MWEARFQPSKETLAVKLDHGYEEPCRSNFWDDCVVLGFMLDGQGSLQKRLRKEQGPSIMHKPAALPCNPREALNPT